MPDPTLGVDEVKRRPVVIGECLPDLVVAVDGDRIVDLPRLYRPPDVVEVVLEREFRRVHPDRHEPLVPVPMRPGSVVSLRAQPVDAGVGPELNHDHLAAKTARRQTLGVEPCDRPAEGRHRAFEREVRRCDAEGSWGAIAPASRGHAPFLLITLYSTR